jgi:putative glutamine amidotransferase
MPSPMRPLIGIPAIPLQRVGTPRPYFGLGKSYLAAVERAGGIPLMIPPLADPADAEALGALLARMDGLLLSGGGDVDPRYYGEERLPVCGEPEPERDTLEIPLARLAIKRGTPVLGICRGVQLLNVALGGTLYQDITAQRPEAPPHVSHDYNGARDATAHSIRIQPGSLLERIVGAEHHAVNSFHHQAIKDAAPGVELIAWSEDGIPEALVAPGHPFALGVQFHPEELVFVDPASQRIFDAFVAACAERMRSTDASPVPAHSVASGA